MYPCPTRPGHRVGLLLEVMEVPYKALKKKVFLVCGLQLGQVKAMEVFWSPGALQEKGFDVG